MHGSEDMVDLSVGGSAPSSPAQPSRAGRGLQGRPYLRLYFRCANQYTRAYLNAEGTGYTGRCPTCGACMRFRIGPGGTSERFFEVSC